jgi:hypothetical protein
MGGKRRFGVLLELPVHVLGQSQNSTRGVAFRRIECDSMGDNLDVYISVQVGGEGLKPPTIGSSENSRTISLSSQ